MFNEFIDEIVEDEKFKIDSDSNADWAVQKIKAEGIKRDRLQKVIDDQISFLQDKKAMLEDSFENNTKYLKGRLDDFFQGIDEKDKKKTKTQTSYKLISGTLVFKKVSESFVNTDNEKIQTYLETNNLDKFIKTEKKVLWGELKKSDNVLAEIPGVELVKKPGEFLVK